MRLTVTNGSWLIWLISFPVWGALCPLGVIALRRWAHSLYRPWVGGAIVFAGTLALLSLYITVAMRLVVMPIFMNARYFVLAFAILEGAALLVSAIIARVSFKRLNAGRW